MKKLLIGMLPFAGLVGCATPSYNYIPTVQNLSKPPIGQVATASIGDHMLTQGIMTEQEALYIPSLASLTGYKLGDGYYAKRGEDDKYIQFTADDNSPGAGKVTKNPFVDPYSAVVLRKSDNSLCIMTVFNVVAGCKSGINFEKRNWAKSGANNFQQTLIYNGKVGNKINVGYREFSSDLARPAFNNEVEYDLSQSKQIGYKGALIDVMDANNQSITYKVLKNFNTDK